MKQTVSMPTHEDSYDEEEEAEADCSKAKHCTFATREVAYTAMELPK